MAWSTAKPKVPDLFQRIMANEAARAEARSAAVVGLDSYRSLFRDRRFLMREADRFCFHKNGGAQ